MSDLPRLMPTPAAAETFGGVTYHIDIEAGGRLYNDPSVRMETVIDRLSNGLFGGVNFIVNRFTGPGRVGIQSMYMHIPTEE